MGGEGWKAKVLEVAKNFGHNLVTKQQQKLLLFIHYTQFVISKWDEERCYVIALKQHLLKKKKNLKDSENDPVLK